jgi:hypothetical protein
VDEATALAEREDHRARAAGEQLCRRRRLAAGLELVTDQELGLDLVRAQDVHELV